MSEAADTVREWRIYVHEGEPRYLSINDGVHGDTLLKTSDGHVDQAQAAKFVAWVNERAAAAERADTLAEALQELVAVQDGPRGRDFSRQIFNAWAKARAAIADRATDGDTP